MLIKLTCSPEISAKLRDQPNNHGNTVCLLDNGTTVEVFTYPINGFWKLIDGTVSVEIKYNIVFNNKFLNLL